MENNLTSECVLTDRGGSCIQTVLDELFRDRAQVNDNLTGLDLVYLERTSQSEAS